MGTNFLLIWHQYRMRTWLKDYHLNRRNTSSYMLWISQEFSSHFIWKCCTCGKLSNAREKSIYPTRKLVFLFFNHFYGKTQCQHVIKSWHIFNLNAVWFPWINLFVSTNLVKLSLRTLVNYNYFDTRQDEIVLDLQFWIEK